MRYGVLLGLVMLGCGSDDAEPTPTGVVGDECTPNGVISGADCAELVADISQTLGGVKVECVQNQCSFWCGRWSTSSGDPDPHPDADDECEAMGGSCLTKTDDGRRFCAP